MQVVPLLVTTLPRWIRSKFARFHLAPPFAETWDRKTLQMFCIKVSPSLELWIWEPRVRGGQSGVVGLWSVLGEIWPEHRWALQWVFIKMSQENFRTSKVSISAKVLPARCGGAEQQLDHDSPVLRAKSEANRQKLWLLLKWVPRGVQTLNDLQFITTLSS